MSTPGQDALKRVNFFVIGAAKCGTTTLYARLNAHPEVFLSPLKEPNYYSRADLDPARFSKAFKTNTKLDLTDYLAQADPLPDMQVGFVQSEADYARLFSGATDAHRVVGECSTSYLWSPSAPEALHAAHPEAKIVVALRDPVERIFSHYLMARKYGFVKGSVVEAVKADLAHPDPSWGRSELFVELSLFEAQIARWRALFPDSQLHILQPGALRRDETWHDLQAWLGLTPRDLLDGGADELLRETPLRGLVGAAVRDREHTSTFELASDDALSFVGNEQPQELQENSRMRQALRSLSPTTTASACR